MASIWVGRADSESGLSTRISAARVAMADSGEQQLLIKTFPSKGIRFVGAAQEQKSAPATAFLLPDKPSIAVLPFTNMSGDSEQDYFADGMAEEIITALSRCKWLFVIARYTSLLSKGQGMGVMRYG